MADGDDERADDLLRLAREALEGRHSGGVIKEVTFAIDAPDVARAARVLERRGLAMIADGKVTVVVDVRPPWLR